MTLPQPARFDEIQGVQEAQYSFPYHYIPSRTDRGVSVCARWGWGLQYLAGLDVALHHLTAAGPTSLLDIGCGDGRFLREVHVRTGIRDLLGIDYSARAVALAQALNPSLAYAQIDLTTDCLPRKFDAAALIEVLEHIPPDTIDAFLKGTRQCLRHGATLVVTVPHANYPLADKHYQHFTSSSLSAALAPHFKVERIVPFGGMSLALRAAARLLGLTGGRITFDSERLNGLLYRSYLKDCIDGQSENHCTRLLAIVRT